jgi:para-nitrobenzyl esterase
MSNGEGNKQMSVIVETTGGQLAGVDHGHVVAFLGVPYAMAPTGERRFRAPRPAAPWTGVREAARFGGRAVQTPMNPEQPPEDPGGEDCLYLNVYAPKDASGCPVVFWVHGGAFVMGSGNDLDGRALAARGAVVVSVNYRIGPFGYLYLEELAPGATDTNLALRDLALALDWTRDNAATFGGDAGKILLAGESSGAMTIGAMLAMPALRGRYAAAMLMSGAARQVRSPKVATRSALMYLDALGLDRSEAAKLTELPTEALAAASGVLGRYSQRDEQFDAEVVLPVFGDDVLPEHPMSAVRAGAARTAALFISWTLKDMALFRIFDGENGGKNKELFARRLIGDDEWGRLERHYREGGDDWYVDLLTDFHFSIPARRLAEAQTGAGGRAYVARFDRGPVTPPWERFGPVHTCDIFYLFTPLDPPAEPYASIAVGTGMLAEDRPLAEQVRDVALDLASGAPPAADLGWPTYELSGRPTMLFDEPSRVAEDPDGERRSAWDGLLE